jgi:hypothetical protein
MEAKQIISEANGHSIIATGSASYYTENHDPYLVSFKLDNGKTLVIQSPYEDDGLLPAAQRPLRIDVRDPH